MQKEHASADAFLVLRRQCLHSELCILNYEDRI